jgi:archaellum component FlaC
LRQLNSNYQTICLHQNVDDLAKDVLDVKNHVSEIHQDLNQQKDLSYELKSQSTLLHVTLSRIDKIEYVLEDIKELVGSKQYQPITYDDKFMD